MPRAMWCDGWRSNGHKVEAAWFFRWQYRGPTTTPQMAYLCQACSERATEFFGTLKDLYGNSYVMVLGAVRLGPAVDRTRHAHRH